ncbi:hypothetical protein [Candidatus Leptofilum sp.]|uniref:hypothetical protein n=1 Tax=Candidatus Leptofilum sp. TaxID=3241576 RepID=UPI003B595999
MTKTKPTITKFRWHEKYLAIDWSIMMWAFVITSLDGGAKILNPSEEAGKPGIQAAISFGKIRGFVLREDSDTGYAEVMLLVKFESGELCLGLTKQVEEAQKWVIDANQLLQNVQMGKSNFD